MRLGAGVIRLFLFVAVAGTAGVLVAGLLLPLVGGAGLAARSAADSFDNLPEALRQPVLAQQSRILASDGSLITTFYTQNRITVPLSKISPKLQDALVAIEDNRFYEHKGIDVKGLMRAYVTNQQAGETKQGGSTITQQYVKQVLLLTASTEAQRKAATADNYGRKLREAKLAIGLEKRWTKKQILQALSQHRLLRRQGVRRRGGQRELLRRARLPADARPGGHPRRTRPAARTPQSARLPLRRAGPPRHRPGQDARAEVHQPGSARPRGRHADGQGTAPQGRHQRLLDLVRAVLL